MASKTSEIPGTPKTLAQVSPAPGKTTFVKSQSPIQLHAQKNQSLKKVSTLKKPSNQANVVQSTLTSSPAKLAMPSRWNFLVQPWKNQVAENVPGLKLKI
jgi:hypothetical protein